MKTFTATCSQLFLFGDVLARDLRFAGSTRLAEAATITFKTKTGGHIVSDICKEMASAFHFVMSRRVKASTGQRCLHFPQVPSKRLSSIHDNRGMDALWEGPF